jgi:hypothetical protein
LLSSQVTDDSADNVPLDTALYTYDEHNRLKTASDGIGPARVTFTMAYDDQGRMTTAKKFSSKGNLIIEFDFFYRGDTTGYYFYGPTHPADMAYFTFNTKHQLTLIQTKHSGSQVYAYDSGGNVSTTQFFNADGSVNISGQASFEYDKQKNPQSQMAPNNYFFMYIVMLYNPSTLVNNMVFKNGDTYTYNYNNAGFPTKATIKTFHANVYVYYNYIVK